MEALVRIGATRAQWTKAAASAEQITTLDQLHKAIADTYSPGGVGIPKDDAQRRRRDQVLEEFFRISHSTVRFGWETDICTIVLFDARGRQKYIYPYRDSGGWLYKHDWAR